MDAHESTEELGAANLEDHNDTPDNEESRIGTNAIEDVDLIVDFSRAYHVEDLHEHKQVEHNREVARRRVTDQGLIHRLPFFVLLHAQNDVELVIVPFLKKRLIEIWVDCL